MPKRIEAETLSRFFRKNLRAIKSRNVAANFEVSPYFLNVVKGKASLKKIKETNFKQKPIDPPFKGFPKECRDFASNKKIQLDRAVTLHEDRIIKEAESFSGFSSEEITNSKLLCDQITTRDFCIGQQPFRGFSKEDWTESASRASKILEARDAICTTIYKNIDKRILTSHKMEIKPQSKRVCSKYWLKGDINFPLKPWRSSGVTDDKSLIERSTNEIKAENIQTDDKQFDKEKVILSEIQRLHEELWEIRKAKYTVSEETKLQNSPFVQIKKELIISHFVPPKSPHYLLEEELYHDPWALLVATIFLNKTSARSARPYVFWFLDENPDPLTVVGKQVEQLETYFGALGLRKTRAKQVWRMSHDFLYKEWNNVGELYGIGRYAEDAFRMFCLGDFSVEPKDRYLKIYKAWYEMQEERKRLKEMNMCD